MPFRAGSARALADLGTCPTDCSAAEAVHACPQPHCPLARCRLLLPAASVLHAPACRQIQVDHAPRAQHGSGAIFNRLLRWWVALGARLHASAVDWWAALAAGWPLPLRLAAQREHAAVMCRCASGRLAACHRLVAQEPEAPLAAASVAAPAFTLTVAPPSSCCTCRCQL